MTDTRALDHIRAELDDPFTPHLLALADWHEENGKDALARAYRRIVREGKTPDVRNVGWSWLEHSETRARYFVTPEIAVRISRHLDAMGLVGRPAPLSQTYHALALAYAELDSERFGVG